MDQEQDLCVSVAAGPGIDPDALRAPTIRAEIFLTSPEPLPPTPTEPTPDDAATSPGGPEEHTGDERRRVRHRREVVLTR